MAIFTPEQNQQIIQQIKAKIGPNRLCPMCGGSSWFMNDGLALLPLQQPRPGTFAIGGNSLPNITLTCATCGNTVLFNAFVLGVADILGITPAKPEGSK